MARQLINPKQTSECARVLLSDGTYLNVFRDNGVFFSDDKVMDKVIEELKSNGFVEVKKAKEPENIITRVVEAVAPSVKNKKKR